MRLMSILAAFALLVVPAAASEEKDPDKAAIEAAVYDYFHGQGEASEERLFRAFAADHASMVGVVKNDNDEEELKSWKDMSEVLTNWASNDNPPGTEREGEILNIQITDGRIATAHFRSADRFYDVLTLAKLDGEWKIIAKAFVLQ